METISKRKKNSLSIHHAWDLGQVIQLVGFMSRGCSCFLTGGSVWVGAAGLYTLTPQLPAFYTLVSSRRGACAPGSEVGWDHPCVRWFYTIFALRISNTHGDHWTLIISMVDARTWPSLPPGRTCFHLQGVQSVGDSQLSAPPGSHPQGWPTSGVQWRSEVGSGPEAAPCRWGLPRRWHFFCPVLLLLPAFHGTDPSYGWWFTHSVVSDSFDPVDCSPPDFSVHGILQARTLEQVAISFFKRSSPLRIKPVSPYKQIASLSWFPL